MHDASDKRLVRIDWHPSAASLRSFGAAVLIVLALSLARAPARELLHEPRGLISGGLALLVALLTVARPAWLRPAYVVVGVTSYPVRWLIAVLSLAVLYYGLITPIAVGLRLVRKHRAQSVAAGDRSAWVETRPRRDKAHYFRQF